MKGFTPKITLEDLERLQKECDERQKRNIELSKLEKEYRKLIKQNKLHLKLNWQNKISEIDTKYLFSKVTLPDFQDFDNNFCVQYLDIDRILNFHCNGEKSANKIYPKDKLWSTSHRNNSNMAQLIEYIKGGNKLCPPIIDYGPNQCSDSDVFCFFDGNHRVALCRFLNIKKIPFIVRKLNLEKIKNI